MSWIQLGNDINGEVSFDNSGSSVSLSSDGNILAIGAPTNNLPGTDSGHVRVYFWNGATTTTTTTTTIAPISQFDLFIIQNNKLYINSEVLNFGMPAGNYSVNIKIIDIETNDILITRSHTVQVIPCPCN